MRTDTPAVWYWSSATRANSTPAPWVHEASASPEQS